MPTSPSRSVLPLLAVATTLVLWSSAFVGIRHLGEEVPPGALSLGRLLVMVVAMLVLLRGRVPRLPTGREVPLVLLGGVTWFGVYNVAINEAERRIDAGTAALVIQVGPILVALCAAVFLGERLTTRLLLGMAVALAGVAVIARASSSGDGDLVGVLLMLVCAAAFAVGVITQKLLLPTIPALQLTFWYTVVGAVSCLPWTVELVDVVGSASADTLWWVVYLGVFPSAIAFTTWAYALSQADAGTFAQSTFLVPFLTSLMAWALLDEVPPALAFVGGALCIAGVVLARRTPRAQAGTTAPPSVSATPASTFSDAS